MNTLMSCLRIFCTFVFIFSFSAISNSATFKEVMKLLIKQVDNFLVNNFALNVNTHLDLEENHALLC